MALRSLNPNAQGVSKNYALQFNFQAAKGLMEILKSNLGPRGTIKMLVGGSGDLKLTKDGNVLLHEMQIQHPTAVLIARSATAQDEVIGDGTTSVVLLTGDLLRQAERLVGDGVHPRIIVDGFDLGRQFALDFLEKFKQPHKTSDRELLLNVARTSLRSKLTVELADMLTSIVVDSILTIKRGDAPVDLFMVEIMTMQHRAASEMRLIKGLVLDHGSRHPDMKKKLENCFILTCNINLEWEKSEINAVTVYSDVKQRDKLVEAERKHVDDKVRKIIELKHKVCDTPDKNFVIINQKGIDPMALDMLAKAGIFALRRAKRRNMERLVLACGGRQVNEVDEALTLAVLGHADLVTETTLGEDKFTFVEGVKDPQSVSILIKGPNSHTIAQIKDAVRDGLRAVKGAIEDGVLIPGAGAFEVACSQAMQTYSQTVPGRAKWGVQAFAEAMLVIPKTLAENSGFDTHDALLALQDQHRAGHVVGLDLWSGEPMDPATEGIWDLYRVKKQMINSATVIAEQLLLVDEVLKASKTGKEAAPQE
jgi:T-complex protein 1 subunit zeta